MHLILHDLSGVPHIYTSTYINYLTDYLELQSYYELCLSFDYFAMMTTILDVGTILESLTLEEKASPCIYQLTEENMIFLWEHLLLILSSQYSFLFQEVPGRYRIILRCY
jgi:hypothetical protein